MWLYGASGHGKVILECLEAHGYTNISFVDDDKTKKDICGFEIFPPSYINPLTDFVIISIGDNTIRYKIVSNHNYSYISIKHPSAIISPRSTIGSGTVIFHHSVIQTGSSIGNHCIINTAASVDHDCIIDDFVHISPNVTLCGGVSIGEGSHIGAGTTIIPGVKVGKWSVIGAGAVVTKNIPDYSVFVGVPAKFIKYNNQTNKL
ncbi:MAG: acetyltransferase [Bacteroidales bacterium]|nr:acetyltransferase [Bacteroidales bacterium]